MIFLKSFRNRPAWLFKWDFRNRLAVRKMIKLTRGQIMRKKNKTGKRLRFVPLILGLYGAYLGFGLVLIGLSEMNEGIGVVRLLIGIGLAGFGLLGIWDGVRDLVGPDKKPEQAPKSQFILTDTSGNRSSNVTVETLYKQLESMMESEKGGLITLQFLPPLAAEEIGNISQIFCMYQETFLLTAFLDESKGGYESYYKSADFDETKNWFEKLLSGNADLSGWKKKENIQPWEEEDAGSGKADTGLDEKDSHFEEEAPRFEEAEDMPEVAEETVEVTEETVEAFWHQLQRDQKNQMRNWCQYLIIFGESWHDEHRFFSARDVELTIEGIHEGKYTKALLEWGTNAFDLFPGLQNDLMVIFCTNNTGKGQTRFLAKEGTVTQVKFWMVNYLDHGFLEEMNGWADITAQIEKLTARMEKEKRKSR